jgi:hypothetical protein
MAAPDTKTLCYSLSALALAGVLLGACGSPPPPEPVATAPSDQYVATIPPPAPTTTTTTVTTYSSEATAPMAPPPPRTEVIPPSTGPQMVWEPGYWSFNGANWDWIPGHYAAPATDGAVDPRPLGPASRRHLGLDRRPVDQLSLADPAAE